MHGDEGTSRSMSAAAKALWAERNTHQTTQTKPWRWGVVCWELRVDSASPGSPWAEPGVRDAEKHAGIEEPPIKPSLPESAGGAKWRNVCRLFLSVLIVSRCALLAAKILVVCECISFHR